MRAWLLALVVLLAGCPGLGSQPTTVTPAPVPADRTFPPGIGPGGVVDPAALAEAHDEAVENASYTIVSNRTMTTKDGDLRSLLDVRVRLAADRSYLVTARTAGPSGPVFMGRPPALGTYWSNGSTYVRMLARSDGAVVNEFSPPDSFVGSWRYWRSTVAFGGGASFDLETVGSLFASIPTSLVGNRTANGTTLYHLEGDRALDTDFAKAGGGPVSNVTLSATVGEAGVVRAFDLAYERRVDGELLRVSWHLRYENVGSTRVERPAWVDRALAQDSEVTGTSTDS